MSYEKHTWVTNEAITASKMNNIETGIEEASQSGGGGGTQITANVGETSITLDASYSDLKQMLLSGSMPFLIIATGDVEQDGYESIVRYQISDVSYTTDADPDYPYMAHSSSGTGAIITFKAANAADDMTYSSSGNISGEVY